MVKVQMKVQEFISFAASLALAGSACYQLYKALTEPAKIVWAGPTEFESCKSYPITLAVYDSLGRPVPNVEVGYIAPRMEGPLIKQYYLILLCCTDQNGQIQLTLNFTESAHVETTKTEYVTITPACRYKNKIICGTPVTLAFTHKACSGPCVF
jgi:hypothetical protein